MQKRRGDQGFTLIELLVVIAIIGLLSSVVLVSLGTARLKSRDARRVADVGELRKALEIYNNDNRGRYPTPNASPYYLTGVTGLTPTYIATLPKDPSIAIAGTGNDIRYYTDATRSTGYSIAIYPEKTGAWCRYTIGNTYPAAWSAYPACEQI